MEPSDLCEIILVHNLLFQNDDHLMDMLLIHSGETVLNFWLMFVIAQNTCACFSFSLIFILMKAHITCFCSYRYALQQYWLC